MQNKVSTVSNKFNLRWLLVVLMTILGVGVFLSSVYFLFIPAGFQGGRNPYYGITLLFDRESWDELHLWTGLVMIVILAVHIVIHWQWIKVMAKRLLDPQFYEKGRNNARALFNVVLNLVAAISFILASLSGIYFMFAPSRSMASTAPHIIFDWYTWDVIHTWSGVVMFLSVFMHIYIHWNWIVRMLSRSLSLGRSNSKQIVQGVQNG